MIQILWFHCSAIKANNVINTNDCKTALKQFQSNRDMNSNLYLVSFTQI